jgi:predicted enzyme related to lactoylglutathione lyase
VKSSEAIGLKVAMMRSRLGVRARPGPGGPRPRPAHTTSLCQLGRVVVWKDRVDENKPKGGSTPMKMKLELIPLPVSDVDRAIAFYADKLGFTKDFDVQPGEGVRIVQLTPEGSGCSVGFGTGMDVYAGEPGSARGLHLVVEDIAEARAELVGRGVEVGEIQDFGGGVRGADFADPDGNTLELQEMAWRKGATY